MNLSYGSSGDEVKKLQTSLINAGYSVGSSGADGKYGPATQAAVTKYQTDNGLKVDGIAGSETLGKLYSTASTGTTAQTTTTTTPATSTQPAAYDPSSDAAYQSALAALQAASQNAPTYAGTYDQGLKDLYDQIVNRDKFSYDINSDALYQQYAQQYQTMGKLAMQDTMGQAAALTGGYGSSYGQSVGQQQYDAYLQKLNEAVPELYSKAYQRYQDEGTALQNQYAMLGDLADQEYSRYNDAYNKWLTERSYAQERADTEYNRGYQEENDKQNLAQNKAETLAGYGDFSGYADIYGEDTANRMYQTWLSSNPELAYRNGNITAEEYYAMTGEYPAGSTPATTATYSGGGLTGKQQVIKTINDVDQEGGSTLDQRAAVYDGIKSGLITVEEARELFQTIAEDKEYKDGKKIT